VNSDAFGLPHLVHTKTKTHTKTAGASPPLHPSPLIPLHVHAPHTRRLAASGKYEDPIVTEIKPAAMFWPAEVRG
jgi:hypothetical protein